ncbi:hypothetical protein [Johnsonella ignava]|uniref:hypothetical protein n=1 Tax=Johnsonella ignava TaxID=43995 RepID=UPI0023F1FC1A|nr:hypothetical protein [Johnsonella ignava]
MTSFGRKLEKCILMMTFIAVVLNFINLILYSNEHRIEVKHFLQTNFKISFSENKLGFPFLQGSCYELTPGWNCEVYAMNGEKVLYHHDALCIPFFEGIYDIPGIEYGYFEYRGNDEDIKEMLQITCNWFKEMGKIKELDYSIIPVAGYSTEDAALLNDPGMSLIPGYKGNIKTDIDLYTSTYSDSSVTRHPICDAIVTEKEDRKQDLILVEYELRFPGYFADITLINQYFVTEAKRVLVLYERQEDEFIKYIKDKIKAGGGNSGFYCGITDKELIFRLKINGKSPDSIEKVSYNEEDLYFWCYNNLVIDKEADLLDVNIMETGYE